MKKIFSLIAGIVLTIGFVSCGTGLHDVDPSPLGILGIGVDGDNNYAILMNYEGDGSEQFLKFKWASGELLKATNEKEFGVQDGWGKNDGNLTFAVAIPSSVTSGDDPISAWTGVRRSPKSENVYLTPGNTEYTPLFLSSSYPEGNIVVNGLVDGEEYTIYAKYDSSTESVSVRIDGKSSDPTQFRIAAENSKSFPETDKDGKTITYGMAKAGNEYTYQFIAAKDEDIVFSIENDLLGSMVENSKLSVKKDFEYKITFTKKPGKAGTLKTESIPLLKNAEFLTNTQHDYDYYNEKFLNWLVSEKTLLFKAPATSFNLKIGRVAGDNSKMWVKSNGNITEKGVPVKMNYIDTDKDKNAIAEPITIGGLKKDAYYWLNIESEADATIMITLADAELQKPEQMQGSAGNVSLSYDENNIAKVLLPLSSTYEDGWNNKNKTTISFALLAKENQWDPSGTVYKNATLTLDGDEVLIPPSNSSGNNVIKSEEALAGKKIKLIIKSDFAGVSVKAETVK